MLHLRHVIWCSPNKRSISLMCIIDTMFWKANRGILLASFALHSCLFFFYRSLIIYSFDLLKPPEHVIFYFHRYILVTIHTYIHSIIHTRFSRLQSKCRTRYFRLSKSRLCLNKLKPCYECRSELDDELN